MVRTSIAIAIAASLLTACASVTGSKDAPSAASSKETPLDRLAPRELDSGDCGLFVFNVDTNPRLVLFSDNIGNYGVWASGTGEAPLTITSTDGDPAMGQYPVQSFRAATGQSLSLNLETGSEIDKGMQFPTGTLKVSDPEGWERVTPVSAWAACQN